METLLAGAFSSGPNHMGFGIGLRNSNALAFYDGGILQ